MGVGNRIPQAVVQPIAIENDFPVVRTSDRVCRNDKLPSVLDVYGDFRAPLVSNSPDSAERITPLFKIDLCRNFNLF